MKFNIKLQKSLNTYSNFCPCHGLVCGPYCEWQWYIVLVTKGKKERYGVQHSASDNHLSVKNIWLTSDRMCYLGQVTGLLHLKVNYLQNMKVGLLNDFPPTQLCTVCCSPNEILNRGQHVTHQNCGRGGLGEPKAPVLNLHSSGKAPEASLGTLRALRGVGKKDSYVF